MSTPGPHIRPALASASTVVALAAEGIGCQRPRESSRHLAAWSEIGRVTIHHRALADHELLELASEDPGVL